MTDPQDRGPSAHSAWATSPTPWRPGPSSPTRWSTRPSGTTLSWPTTSASPTPPPGRRTSHGSNTGTSIHWFRRPTNSGAWRRRRGPRPPAHWPWLNCRSTVTRPPRPSSCPSSTERPPPMRARRRRSSAPARRPVPPPWSAAVSMTARRPQWPTAPREPPCSPCRASAGWRPASRRPCATCTATTPLRTSPR
jgi:hypothetical protein